MSAANLSREAGSYRDPSGTIYYYQGRVLRAVSSQAEACYLEVKRSGLYERLAEKGKLVGLKEIEPDSFFSSENDVAVLLEHPCLDVISYPYEWTFSALKSAALFHLDLHLELLEEGFTLCDATAYNVQFINTKPIFIDHLSIRPYVDGEPWAAHQQFCKQFLAPLILCSKVSPNVNLWLRGSLEGVDIADVDRILTWKHKLSSWTIFSHIYLQAYMQNRSSSLSTSGIEALKGNRVSLVAFKAMLSGLRSYIASLSLRNAASTWMHYAQINSYTDHDVERKKQFVHQAVSSHKPALLWDIGCNTGVFSFVALDAGAEKVVGWDYDYNALEHAFFLAQEKSLNFFPVWMDAANPSPNQGWAQQERKGFFERSAKTNMVISLAFLHHICIGRQVPLAWAIDWLLRLAPCGVIEFVTEDDPMVKKMCALKTSVTTDYNATAFLDYMQSKTTIVHSERLASGTRILVHYRSNEA